MTRRKSKSSKLNKVFDRLLLILLAAAMLMFIFAKPSHAALSHYQKLVDATVMTRTDHKLGSGFFVSEHYIVTCAHVLAEPSKSPEDMTVDYVDTVTIILGDTENSVTGKVVYVNGDHDVAVVRVDIDAPQFLTIIPEGISDVQVSDRVYAVGSLHGFQATYLEGVVSGLGRQGDMDGVDLVQVSMSLSQGMSGSALVNEQNEVVGIIECLYGSFNPAEFAIDIHSVDDEVRTAIENDRLHLRKAPRD